MIVWKKFLFILLFVVNVFVFGNASGNHSCADLHKLYEEAKNLVNVQRLYDGLLELNQVTPNEQQLGFKYFNFEFSQPMSHNASEEYLKAKIFTQTASLFYDRLNFTDTEAPEHFQSHSHCFLEPPSLPTKLNYFSNAQFRSITGHGNNIKYPRRGASFTSYGRLLKHHYDDHVYAIRKSMRGYELPSPRNIVRKIFLNDRSRLEKFQNLERIPNMLFLGLAQLLKHDTGSKQIGQHAGGSAGIRCCAHANRLQLPPSLMHSSCLPITVSRSDAFYAPKNVRCMDFVRSAIVSSKSDEGRIEVGEQVNRVTAFLDLSAIYGSERERLASIRSFNGGRLKTNPGNVLPQADGEFFSGDTRASQSKFFIVIQSLFVRNHNQVADKLALVNPHWGEEKLFEEARKVNIAMYQSLIYNELVPILLGEESKKRLANVVYNVETDASTLNEFSSAAFRSLHAFIPSEFEVRDKMMKVRRLATSDVINESRVTSYENVLRGLIYQNVSTAGYSSEILNKLFKNDRDIGLDLLSMDILRGRDHGIPPYHKLRRFCNVRPFGMKVFNDLAPHIPKSAIIQLRQTYKTVYDIDLLVGAALEEIGEGDALVGPTLKCIMLEQFYRWKAGDYYFYTHDLSEFSFTKDQIKTIESVKMANFVCENSDLEFVQAEAFFNSGDDVSCNAIAGLDLSAWKEETSAPDFD